MGVYWGGFLPSLLYVRLVYKDLPFSPPCEHFTDAHTYFLANQRLLSDQSSPLLTNLEIDLVYTKIYLILKRTRLFYVKMCYEKHVCVENGYVCLFIS